ncbi:MAG: GAF domain-containing protein [Chitinophagaceae bacterium]|nr:GAF domain-containing protein [Chitinophagaceae bacterium]
MNNGRLIIVDYSLMKVTLDMRFPRLMSAAPISNDELLAYPPEGDVFYRISISGQKVIREYRNLHDQYGKPIAANLRYIASMGNEYFAITSRFSGMYFLNLRDEKLYHWPHDPLDQSSIGGNNPYWVSYDTSGYLMITSQTSGLHYLNVKQKQAYSKPYFLDAKGEVFDGFIQSVVTGKDGTVWMGAQDRLISWNRLTNETVYVPCFLPNGINISKEETIRALDFEVSGDLWVGTSRYGVLVIDKNLRTIRHFSDSMPRGLEGLPSNWINEMTTDKDGNEWIGTLKGTCMIEKRSNQVISFSDHPVLSPVSKIPCNTLWKDRNGRMWIGTTKGAWCFDAFNNSLKHFSTDNGLPQNNVLAINEDDLGNTYIGTPGGLTIITSSGSTRTYNRSNGMRNDRCEGILKDDNGFIWIGNLNCITRYDPRSQKFAVYEEGYGFSHAGFRMRSCHKSASGEMFWGTDKGLTWFYPGDMNSISLPLHPVISALQTADTMYRFTKGESLRFPYNSSSFAFYFSSGELAGGKKIQYLYRLKAFDNNWKTPATLGNVTYSKLPPGEYQFEIRSSYDGLNWFSGAYPITLVIGKPWWQQTWFRILCLLGMALVVYGTIRYFRKRKRERELDGLIDYFTKSGYEHSGVDDILWDISRNCISRMGFTDCVIYLVDRQKNTLVQKAAYGPKNLNAFEITNPIEIPMGKGIVGSVAASGHPVVIGDTSKDDRYIVDDERRLSEISVPIIHDNRVIGVIDSEHPRRNFFNRRQLKTLETIASICSAKISRAMAMDAMKKVSWN